MDPAIVLFILLGLVGAVVLFILKAALITVCASVVAKAISPTITVKRGRDESEGE